jgi:hypothetical protein
MIDKIKIHYGMRGERLYCIQDCAICATHMMLAAHELGLGTCWVGAFDENKVQRVLKIPDNCRPQMILTLGYADEKPRMPPRYPIDNLVFLETYGGPGRIKDMGAVLWDFNVVGRAEKDLKTGARDFERVTRKDRDRLFQRLRDTFGNMPKKREKAPPQKLK